MSDDYELNDEPCPKCGFEPTRYRQCTVVGCDDGWIDMHEYDDPMFFDPGEVEKCDECNGTGFEKWCPNCGWDLSCNRFQNGFDERELQKPE